MQAQLKNRETLAGAVVVYTVNVDASGMSLVTAGLIAHAASGTTPSLTIQLETSDDLENWATVGGTFALTAAGMTKASFTAQSDVYLRYVRCRVTSAGTDPLFNYSLYLNLFPSS